MKEAEREVNYTRLAELQYGEMSRLEGELKKEEERLAELQKSEKMLKEEVDEEDVAEVVSKWTGIPVSRMLEGEVEKLVHMEERLRQRVVGQDDAIVAVSNAVRRARAGLAGSQSAHRFLHLHGTHGCRKDRAGPGPGRVPLR